MQLKLMADGVRQDHALICGELAVLKAEEDNGAQEWQTLRDVCARLSTGLSEHMQREARLASRPSRDHFSDYRYLQVISRSIALENNPYLLNNRFKLVTGFLRGLRCHMDTQESEFDAS